jgi:hypothetical protein
MGELLRLRAIWDKDNLIPCPLNRNRVLNLILSISDLQAREKEYDYD